MSRLLLVLLAGLCVLAVACGGGDDDDGDTGGDGNGDTSSRLTSILLADGTLCRHVAKGDPPAYEGDTPLRYTCGEDGDRHRVIVGDMAFGPDLVTFEAGFLVEAREGAGGPMALEDRAEVERRIAEVQLDDGTVCLNAGQDADDTAGDERINFTCGERDGRDVVLTGGFEFDGDRLTASSARIERVDGAFEVLESSTPSVLSITLVEVE
ncbi:MAG: hypothetical protein WD058_02855 [Dehalococcoidia bacterium]